MPALVTNDASEAARRLSADPEALVLLYLDDFRVTKRDRLAAEVAEMRHDPVEPQALRPLAPSWAQHAPPRFSFWSFCAFLGFGYLAVHLLIAAWRWL